MEACNIKKKYMYYDINNEVNICIRPKNVNVVPITLKKIDISKFRHTLEGHINKHKMEQKMLANKLNQLFDTRNANVRKFQEMRYKINTMYMHHANRIQHYTDLLNTIHGDDVELYVIKKD